MGRTRSVVLLRVVIKIKGKNERTQSKLSGLIEVLFSKVTVFSVSDKSESVNEHNHTDQQKVKFNIPPVRLRCRYDTIHLLTYGSQKSWIITTHIHVHKIHLRYTVITNEIESLKISQ